MGIVGIWSGEESGSGTGGVFWDTIEESGKDGVDISAIRIPLQVVGNKKFT
ncbi:hypothetical protein X556_0769 [Chlamydia pneumoniae B21]|nr:hypothetical protein X556_0769 [Chlamydia pneumoniae B21]